MKEYSSYRGILFPGHLVGQADMQDNSRNTLGIILLNWNAAAMTMRCAGELRKWHRVKPNIYIVDNGSTEGELHAEDGGDVPVFLIQSPTNRGYAGGNNLGIRRALDDGCHSILLLNIDASISEEQMEMLLDHLRRNPDIGCIGPAIHEGDRMYVGGRDIGLHINTRNVTSRISPGNEIIPVDYVPGMVFLTGREVIERIGFLDEQYFFSGEVADFCTRARKEGFRCVIDGGTMAFHVPDEENPHRSSLYQYYSLRNRFLYIRKHHPSLRWMLEPFWVLWGIQRYGLAKMRGQHKESFAYAMALADGMKGRFGDRNELFSL